MMNIYLAGRMRGLKNLNFDRFNKEAKNLRAEGHTVFNPAERDIKKYGERILKKAQRGSHAAIAKSVGLSTLDLARECFLADTKWICSHADAIALIPGWEKSKGARAEKSLAEAIGLRIIHLD